LEKIISVTRYIELQQTIKQYFTKINREHQIQETIYATA